jgi:hypothetical protein
VSDRDHAARHVNECPILSTDEVTFELKRDNHEGPIDRQAGFDATLEGYVAPTPTMIPQPERVRCSSCARTFTRADHMREASPTSEPHTGSSTRRRAAVRFVEDERRLRGRPCS